MVPLVDMLNHGMSCTYQVDKHERNVSLVAKKALKVGDELTFSYWGQKGPQGNFLIQYGFVPADHPAVTIEPYKQLPVRDHVALKRLGCSWSEDEVKLVPLRPGVTLQSIQNDIRCLRIWKLEPADARYAHASGHLDAPMGGPLVQGVRSSWLERDANLLKNIFGACDSFRRPEVKKIQGELLERSSADLRAMVEAENRVLDECAFSLRGKDDKLMARARALLPVTQKMENPRMRWRCRTKKAYRHCSPHIRYSHPLAYSGL